MAGQHFPCLAKNGSRRINWSKARGDSTSRATSKAFTMSGWFTLNTQRPSSSLTTSLPLTERSHFHLRSLKPMDPSICLDGTILTEGLRIIVVVLTEISQLVWECLWIMLLLCLFKDRQWIRASWTSQVQVGSYSKMRIAVVQAEAQIARTSRPLTKKELRHLFKKGSCYLWVTLLRCPY